MLADDAAVGSALSSAIFWAAHDLDPEPGPLLMAVSSGESADSPVAEPPSATPAEAGALLARAALRPPEDDELFEALRLAVDRARYWQPPDGEDVLGATPAMRPGLLGVARTLAASPLTGWWTRRVDLTDQWMVEFEDEAPKRPPPPSEEILARWRSAVDLDEERAPRERPSDSSRNFSGPWWSIPPRALVTTTGGWDGHLTVGVHLIEDRIRDVARPPRRAHSAGAPAVYEVDGPGAWAHLCRLFPLEVTASRRHDWYRATGIDGRWVIPDWSRVAELWAGIHLNLHGYLTTAGSAIRVAHGLHTVLAGWNPDETFWFRSVVSSFADG